MEHTYRIIIEAGNIKDKKNEPIANQEDNNSDSVKKSLVGAIAVYKKAKTFVDAQISHRISTISLRTGQVEAQQRTEFAYGVAQKSLGFVESVAFGAITGNIPGAIIGGVMSLMSMLQSYINKAEKLTLEKQEESIRLSLRNRRTGVTNNGNR